MKNYLSNSKQNEYLKFDPNLKIHFKIIDGVRYWLTPPPTSVVKLRKLKEIRRKNLERNFLDVQLKGQDHYVFIKDNGKAQVVYEEGRWVAEHIRTAILKFNYEIDKIDKLFIKDFTDAELKEYEKISSRA